MFDGSSDSSSAPLGIHDMYDMMNSDDYDSSDDESLPSDREMFEDIIPEIEREPNINFANEEDAANFSGLSIYHYNNSVLRLGLRNLHFFNYTYHSQLSDNGKRQIGVLFAENSRSGIIKQMDITFSEQNPTLDTVFRGPFTEGHALRRFRICSDDDLYSVITLSLNAGMVSKGT